MIFDFFDKKMLSGEGLKQQRAFLWPKNFSQIIE